MFTVAIVGRANVGKSTLFNRLTGEKKAITANLPGTTRDRVYGTVLWQGKNFRLIDTAGLESEKRKDDIDVYDQIILAIEESDLIVFMVDATFGLCQKDIDAIKVVRKGKKPYILIANKYDSDKYFSNLQEFYRLGEKEILAVSALNGRCTGDLLDRIVKNIKKPERKLSDEAPGIKTAIAGRPNVGKSSLLNKLVSKEFALVSEKAGTTRDTNSIEFEYNGEKIIFLDTAGIRRRGRIGKVDEGRKSGQVEKYSVLRSFRAIEESDVVLVLIDAQEGVTAQDLHIIGFAYENYKSIIIVVNKWDLSETKQEHFLRYLKEKVAFASFSPVIFISAKDGKNVNKIPDLIKTCNQARRQRVTTGELNIVLSQDILKKSPPAKRGILPKINYITQAETCPPTFIFFVNKPELIHFSYRRYLENRIREHWNFDGTPINIIFKKKSE